VVSKTKAWGKGAMPYEKDFVEFGRDMEESEKAVKYLGDAGYDMFNCDNGTYDAWYWAHPPQYMPDNCNLEYVEHIKNFTDKPVTCAGRMDPVKAAEEIAAGRLDAVAIARQNLVDPEWITKIRKAVRTRSSPASAATTAASTLQSSRAPQTSRTSTTPASGPLRSEPHHHAA
jgi:2-enoate reductase